MESTDRPAEKTFYNNRGVLVTNSRFEVPGRMFAMAQITSVRVVRTDSYGTAFLLMIAGGLVLAWSSLAPQSAQGMACGALPLALGIAVAVFGRHRVLFIATSGGEAQALKVNALQAKDRAFIASVSRGVKDAIIYRS